MKKLLICILLPFSLVCCLSGPPSDPSAEIVKFSAKRQVSQVLITWETTIEQSSHHFVIQRSPDRKNWANLFRIHALAEPGQGRSYALSDRTAPESGIYYRIKQVDRQGQVLYFPEVRFVDSESVAWE